jgi:hypothetical protein
MRLWIDLGPNSDRVAAGIYGDLRIERVAVSDGGAWGADALAAVPPRSRYE